MRMFRQFAITCTLMLLVPALSLAQTLTFGVAASLKETVTEIAANYEKQTGVKVELIFGASGQILTQIRAGAPIDGFISAANKQVKDAIDGKLADPATRRIICKNSLVLIVPAASTDGPTSFESLANITGKLAMGEPKGVPAGQYATQVLTKLGIADKLTDKIVYGTTVRQVLAYVERGDVTAGIVYLTDAKESGDKVKVVATADEGSHEPILYPGIVLTASKDPAAAKAFLDYLATPQSKAILEKKGFVLPDAPATAPATQPATAPAK